MVMTCDHNSRNQTDIFFLLSNGVHFSRADMDSDTNLLLDQPQYDLISGGGPLGIGQVYGTNPQRKVQNKRTKEGAEEDRLTSRF